MEKETIAKRLKDLDWENIDDMELEKGTFS